MQATSPLVVDVTGSAAVGDGMSAGGGGGETALMQFSVWYQRIHGYISLAACVFGSTSNVMNIAVLTRPSMISPTNVLSTDRAAANSVSTATYFVCCEERPQNDVYSVSFGGTASKLDSFVYGQFTPPDVTQLDRVCIGGLRPPTSC